MPTQIFVVTQQSANSGNALASLEAFGNIWGRGRTAGDEQPLLPPPWPYVLEATTTTATMAIVMAAAAVVAVAAVAPAMAASTDMVMVMATNQE